MDRILRAVPFGMTVALLALAIVGMRWAIGRPSGGRLVAASFATAVADVEDQRRAVKATPPRLLPAENSTNDLLPVSPASRVVFTANFPTEKPAAESAASTGPELTVAPQASESVSATEKPVVESLSEMPIAETWPAADKAKPVESPRDPAEANASPLATAETAKDRSVPLERVAQQADRQIRHGIELAGRGAHFAARSEFIGALRLVAEGLDAERKSSVHGQALAAALTAMKEAEDFMPLGSRLEADVDLSGVIGAHSTPVLKSETGKVTPMIALRCYLTFAQTQFAVAAGREVAGSMALYAMGKLHSALAQNKRSPIAAPESKAVVFYQAALLVYPKNYMAANDLGVLLAQCGNNADARVMLEHSVSLSRQSTSWQNLVVVYRQLGQPALAERAAQQATMLRQAELAKRQASQGANGSVQWVDPQAFAQTSTNAPNSPVATPSPPVRAAGLPPGQQVAATNRPGAERTGPGVARNVGTPGNSRWGTEPIPGYSGAAPAVRSASDTYGPAPTPAAAGRMMWGAPPYQR